MSQSIFSQPNLKEEIHLPSLEREKRIPNQGVGVKTAPASSTYLPNIFQHKEGTWHMPGCGLCVGGCQPWQLFISHWEGIKEMSLQWEPPFCVHFLKASGGYSGAANSQGEVHITEHVRKADSQIHLKPKNWCFNTPSGWFPCILAPLRSTAPMGHLRGSFG